MSEGAEKEVSLHAGQWRKLGYSTDSARSVLYPCNLYRNASCATGLDH
jgi:hypothetical protein